MNEDKLLNGILKKALKYKNIWTKRFWMSIK